MNISEQNVARLKEMSKRIRLNAIDMAFAAGEKGAHLGGGLSCVEIMAVLYGEVLRLDPENPRWEDRDRFLPSKNHCVLAHFPALAEAGYLRQDELCDYVKNGSKLIGYPRNVDIGLEYSGGSLGMAISVGVGMALSAREHKRPAKVYVLMGDGELNEGSIWEAFMSAAQYKLDNLVAIIDRNHLCYDGDTEDIMGIDDLGAKMRSFNWNVISCDGHDVADLLRAFGELKEGCPNIIIAETVKGKGVSFIENRREWHHGALNAEQYEIARKEILEG
ncbi:MAG: transketolase [Oscillospiraceae bacterium]